MVLIYKSDMDYSTLMGIKRKTSYFYPLYPSPLNQRSDEFQIFFVIICFMRVLIFIFDGNQIENVLPLSLDPTVKSN